MKFASQGQQERCVHEPRIRSEVQEMDSVNENVKVKTGTGRKINTSTQVQAEVSRGAVRALNAAGVLVALWVAACIIGGMIASGGPVALVKGWFSAVMGF